MGSLLVHEWIERHGGSENVFAVLAQAFPEAEIRCLWNDAPERFAGRVVTESWMARTPLRRNKVAALPLMPTTWAHMDVSEYDAVLVSSHLFAHHIGGPVRDEGPRKYVYVHTPARYIWAPTLDHRGNNIAARLAAPFLKRVDSQRAREGSIFAANSQFIRNRIRSAWQTDAEVIYPPVDVARMQAQPTWRDQLGPRDEAILASMPSQFILGASRFVRYKRLDAVIDAGQAAGIPVVLAGAGPHRAQLVAAASNSSVPVQFVDQPSDELLYALYETALAFFFPAVEDFGIMPVEAMCLGTPVIVGDLGGAAESVTALRGGVVLNSFTASSLKAGVEAALRVNMNFAREHAQAMFGREVFLKRVVAWLGPTGSTMLTERR